MYASSAQAARIYAINGENGAKSKSLVCLILLTEKRVGGVCRVLRNWKDGATKNIIFTVWQSLAVSAETGAP